MARWPTGRSRRLARFGSAGAGPIPQVQAWSHSPAFPSPSCRHEERPPMTPAVTEATAGNLLVDGALMLGAALFFVTLFRKLGLGATLGYIVAGAIIGPNALRLIGDADSI